MAKRTLSNFNCVSGEIRLPMHDLDAMLDALRDLDYEFMLRKWPEVFDGLNWMVQSNIVNGVPLLFLTPAVGQLPWTKESNDLVRAISKLENATGNIKLYDHARSEGIVYSMGLGRIVTSSYSGSSPELANFPADEPITHLLARRGFFVEADANVEGDLWYNSVTDHPEGAFIMLKALNSGDGVIFSLEDEVELMFVITTIDDLGEKNQKTAYKLSASEAFALISEFDKTGILPEQPPQPSRRL